MITYEPTQEMLEEWKAIWVQYKSQLRPNRKSGVLLLQYLKDKYVLTEIQDKKASDAVSGNVIMNKPYSEKLPAGEMPVPRTFFLENAGNGEQFYRPENKDPVDLWGGDITRIFVGIDLTSGFFMVEGSTMLWDELCAFQGLDERDLENFVCVANYINCLKRFDLLQTVLADFKM